MVCILIRKRSNYKYRHLVNWRFELFSKIESWIQILRLEDNDIRSLFRNYTLFAGYPEFPDNDWFTCDSRKELQYSFNTKNPGFWLSNLACAYSGRLFITIKSCYLAKAGLPKMYYFQFPKQAFCVITRVLLCLLWRDLITTTQPNSEQLTGRLYWST